MIGLLLIGLLGQKEIPPDPTASWNENDRVPRAFDRDRAWGRPTAGLAFFEFAPANGAGMGAACACAAVTGAKGEALTFSRASTGTCTKGNTTTSVNNGDLVSCTSNQPRVMPGGDGSGGLGLLVESSRTNSLLWSGDMSNAAWTKNGSVIAAPTVTGNFATAPDGTLTAARVQFPAATAGGQASQLFQTACPVGFVNSGSVFLKGNGTSSGTVDFWQYNNSGPVCVTCTYNSSTWTRCLNQTTTAAGVGIFAVANDTATCGGTSRAAVDVLISGTQCETGPYATSYIPTTTVAVARAADGVPSFSVVWPATAGSASMAATRAGYPVNNPPSAWAVNLGNAGEYFALYEVSAVVGQATNAGSVQRTATAAGHSLPNSRLATFQSGTTVSLIVDGVLTSTTAGVASSWTPNNINIGNWAGNPTYWPDSVIKQVCVDPSPSRCR